MDDADTEARFFAWFFHINAPFITTWESLKPTGKIHLERSTL